MRPPGGTSHQPVPLPRRRWQRLTIFRGVAGSRSCRCLVLLPVYSCWLGHPPEPPRADSKGLDRPISHWRRWAFSAEKAHDAWGGDGARAGSGKDTSSPTFGWAKTGQRSFPSPTSCHCRPRDRLNRASIVRHPEADRACFAWWQPDWGWKRMRDWTDARYVHPPGPPGVPFARLQYQRRNQPSPRLLIVNCPRITVVPLHHSPVACIFASSFHCFCPPLEWTS